MPSTRRFAATVLFVITLTSARAGAQFTLRSCRTLTNCRRRSPRTYCPFRFEKTSGMLQFVLVEKGNRVGWSANVTMNVVIESIQKVHK